MNVRRGMNPLVATLLFASATFAPAAAQVAQERVDLRVVERIRDEGLQSLAGRGACAAPDRCHRPAPNRLARHEARQ
jgi:hypothetical protein